MSNHDALRAQGEPLDLTVTSPAVQGVLGHLGTELPAIASRLVAENQDMSVPANVTFAQSPDDPNEHAPKWHQYGVITHSVRFGEALRGRVPAHVSHWGLAEPVQAALSEPVDGIPKAELLSVVALVHDLGKFTARTITHDDTGAHVRFADHEAHSGKIVAARHDLLPGLTRAQVGYVATCAALHYELGKVRRAAYAGDGFTVRFTGTSAFADAAREIIASHPNYAAEIGLEFIADNVSKTEVVARSQTDEGIASERGRIEAELRDRGLTHKLISQAMQMPVNLAVAKQYLTIWAEEKTT